MRRVLLGRYMKTYIIQLVGLRTMCSVMPESGPLYPLPHLVRHSPDGFAYGYGGSGPSDLARSIVGDLLNERDPKPSIYRPVVANIISQLKGTGPFFVAEESVREAIEDGQPAS
jgi:hypothetical protein